MHASLIFNIYQSYKTDHRKCLPLGCNDKSLCSLRVQSTQMSAPAFYCCFRLSGTVVVVVWKLRQTPFEMRFYFVRDDRSENYQSTRWGIHLGCTCKVMTSWLCNSLATPYVAVVPPANAQCRMGLHRSPLWTPTVARCHVLMSCKAQPNVRHHMHGAQMNVGHGVSYQKMPPVPSAEDAIWICALQVKKIIIK